MTNDFKTGDVVKLKTSYQQMTIKGLAQKPSSQGTIYIQDRYICVWFDGRNHQQAVFHKDALEGC